MEKRKEEMKLTRTKSRSVKLAELMLVGILGMAMLTLAGCGDKALSDKIKVGTLNGPTGMGLVCLEDEDSVDLQTYQAPDEVVQKLLSGDVDVACLPSNMGAVLNAKTQGQVKVLTTVVNGVLYITENGKSIEKLSDLKGKTIYASGKGGTPEYVLQAMVESAGLKLDEDVQVVWMDAHADVATQLVKTEGAIALLPEPFVTTVTAKLDTVRIALDLNEEWQNLTGESLPMGILVARKEFVESRTEDIDAFLGMVKESIEEVNTASDEIAQKIVDAGFIGDVNICKSVIPRCELTCMNSDESKETLNTFYTKLYDVNPLAIGGKVPGEDLYY